MKIWDVHFRNTCYTQGLYNRSETIFSDPQQFNHLNFPAFETKTENDEEVFDILSEQERAIDKELDACTREQDALNELIRQDMTLKSRVARDRDIETQKQARLTAEIQALEKRIYEANLEMSLSQNAAATLDNNVATYDNSIDDNKKRVDESVMRTEQMRGAKNSVRNQRHAANEFLRMTCKNKRPFAPNEDGSHKHTAEEHQLFSGVTSPLEMKEMDLPLLKKKANALKRVGCPILVHEHSSANQTFRALCSVWFPHHLTKKVPSPVSANKTCVEEMEKAAVEEDEENHPSKKRKIDLDISSPEEAVNLLAANPDFDILEGLFASAKKRRLSYGNR